MWLQWILQPFHLLSSLQESTISKTSQEIPSWSINKIDIRLWWKCNKKSIMNEIQKLSQENLMKDLLIQEIADLMLLLRPMPNIKKFWWIIIIVTMSRRVLDISIINLKVITFFRIHVIIWGYMQEINTIDNHSNLSWNIENWSIDAFGQIPLKKSWTNSELKQTLLQNKFCKKWRETQCFLWS